MQKAFEHLVEYALSKNCTCSVFDGEEWQVKRSTDIVEIVDAIESVDEARVRIRNSAGESLGSALISAYGLMPDETVIDHSDTEFMQEWWDIYEGICNA